MENRLEHLEQFKQILKNYKISDHGLGVLRRSKLVLLVGPTSSGRNTIISKLAETGRYYHIVSDTTRHVRTKDGKPIEKNGREYWFRTEEEVLDDLQTGEYAEAAVIHGQQVSGWNLREIERANNEQKIAVKDIETQGAQTIHSLKPDTNVIFVVPPSFEEWRKRFYNRGAPSPSEILRRLESSVSEFSAALACGYCKFVINDDLEKVVATIRGIVEGGEYEVAQQSHAQKIVEDLKQYALKRIAELEQAEAKDA